jgi:hypothetical protein
MQGEVLMKKPWENISYQCPFKKAGFVPWKALFKLRQQMWILEMVTLHPEGGGYHISRSHLEENMQIGKRNRQKIRKKRIHNLT